MTYATGCYAMDYKDSLPPLGFPALWGMGTTGYIYSEPANSAVRYWLRDYCKVSLGMGANNSGLFLNRKSIIFCPAMTIVDAISDDDWRHHSGYALRAFGWFGANPVTGNLDYGSSRAFAATATEPAGPKVFFMDNIYGSVTTHLDNGNNHQFEGGNVTAGDGSVKWIPISQMMMDAVNSSMVPLGYYSPTGYPAVSDPTAMYSGYQLLGELTLLHPNGTKIGQNHQPQMWAANRRMYGYR